MSRKSQGLKTNPIVSVVICTQNRASLVSEAIASLTSVTKPLVSYEVVVVDNGSVDNTREVVHSLVDTHVSYHFEGRLGLSQARNTGWRAANGRYVAFLDDDAVALPGWVDAIVEGFRYDLSAASLGGPVRPNWHAPRPRWLEDEVAHGLTILDWGSSPMRLDLHCSWIVGANMAFRRDVLEDVGGFDLRLGRRGTMLLSNEDTFLLRKIENRGHVTLYWPQMEVCHPVPKSRLDQDWLLQRSFWQGISDARVWMIEEGADAYRRRLHALQDLIGFPPLDSLSFERDEGRIFTHKCRVARRAGYVTELLGHAGCSDEEN